MRNSPLAISACRHCQHYATEGRRGGHCKQLGAHVQGGWKACCLAIPPFAPTWEDSTGINDDIVPAWLPDLSNIPTVAVASCDSVTVAESTYRAQNSALWKTVSVGETVPA